MTGAADAVIRIEHMFKEYETDAGAVPVLKDVSIVVTPGEFIAVMGHSGSGKSTFMNIVGCLDVATSGSYLLNGRDVGTLDRDELARLRNQVIGFVFQGYNLLPRASLEDNIALPLIYRGTSRGERHARAQEMLAKVGLGAYHRSRPNQISGGQQQRVAIARALIAKPDVVFADEPTGNLDSRSGAEVLSFLRRSVRELGRTVIMVTHDPTAAAYADRVVLLADGRIAGSIDDPTPESVLTGLDALRTLDAPVRAGVTG